MSDDLLKRLDVGVRGLDRSAADNNTAERALAKEAAARIRELEAELAALREARDEVKLPKEEASCVNCDKTVDTREVDQGGNADGAEIDDGIWVCSEKCYDTILTTLEPAPMTPAEAWQPIETAPDFKRVMVAGWQKPKGNVQGYWWWHEDVCEGGKALERPRATLWCPIILPAFPEPDQSVYYQSTGADAGEAG